MSEQATAKVTKAKPVEVLSYRITPCAFDGCIARAIYVIDVRVHGCETKTWTCAVHARPFGASPGGPLA